MTLVGVPNGVPWPPVVPLSTQIVDAYGVEQGTISTGIGSGVQTSRFFPIFIGRDAVVSALCIAVGAGAAGDGRMALFSPDPTTGLPGTLLDQTAVWSTAGSANAALSGGNLSVLAGRYWVSLVTSVSINCYGSSTIRRLPFGGITSIANAAINVGHFFGSHGVVLTTPFVSNPSIIGTTTNWMRIGVQIA